MSIQILLKSTASVTGREHASAARIVAGRKTETAGVEKRGYGEVGPMLRSGHSSIIISLKRISCFLARACHGLCAYSYKKKKENKRKQKQGGRGTPQTGA